MLRYTLAHPLSVTLPSLCVAGLGSNPRQDIALTGATLPVPHPIGESAEGLSPSHRSSCRRLGGGQLCPASRAEEKGTKTDGPTPTPTPTKTTQPYDGQ